MNRQSLIKGTIILGIASVIAKFLGIFFRWPVIMLIGDEGIGYYQLCYPLYMCFIAAATGVPIAISKIISQRYAFHDESGVLDVVDKGFILMTILGGGFSLIFIMFPYQIISVLKWDSKAYYSLIGIGMAPLFIGIMSVYRGFFQGMHNMTPTGISQIVEQIGRVLFGVGLVAILLPKGIEVAAGGAAFGAAAGAILGSLYLHIKFVSYKKHIIHVKRKRDYTVMSELLKNAIPISVGALVGSIMSVIDSFLVPSKLLEAGFNSKQATIMYGQLTGKAQIFVNLPLTIATAIGVSLMPIIAENYILNRRIELVNKISVAIKLSMTIAIPCFLGLFYLSDPILQLIFPGHNDGGQILKIAAVGIPFTVMTQITTSVLQGTNHYYVPIKNMIIGCIIKAFITYNLVCIPYVNIYGAILGSIISYLVIAMLNTINVRKRVNISINFYQSIIKPTICSLIMIIVVVLVKQNVYNITMNSNLSCLSAIGVGGIIYLFLIMLFGVFRYDELKSKFSKS
jgi:stage V sporulation protein B